MDRNPSGILSIPPEFLDSNGFQQNSWIPAHSGRNQWRNEKYCLINGLAALVSIVTALVNGVIAIINSGAALVNGLSTAWQPSNSITALVNVVMAFNDIVTALINGPCISISTPNLHWGSATLFLPSFDNTIPQSLACSPPPTTSPSTSITQGSAKTSPPMASHSTPAAFWPTSRI